MCMYTVYIRGVAYGGRVDQTGLRGTKTASRGRANLLLFDDVMESVCLVGSLTQLDAVTYRLDVV